MSFVIHHSNNVELHAHKAKIVKAPSGTHALTEGFLVTLDDIKDLGDNGCSPLAERDPYDELLTLESLPRGAH